MLFRCEITFSKVEMMEEKNILIVFFLRFYSFIHERHRERERQREKQAPLREPDVGLNPRFWDHALS